MQVGKTAIAGTSMMVLTIDDVIPQSVIDEVMKIDGIFDAKLVNFYAV
jgi:D-3-phosphoglycerate dehydrogenase